MCWGAPLCYHIHTARHAHCAHRTCPAHRTCRTHHAWTAHAVHAVHIARVSPMTDSLITRGRCTCCRQRLRRWLHRLQVQQHTNTGTAATVKLNKEYGAPRAYHAPKLPPALVGAAAASAVATSPVAACAHTLFFRATEHSPHI